MNRFPRVGNGIVSRGQHRSRRGLRPRIEGGCTNAPSGRLPFVWCPPQSDLQEGPLPVRSRVELKGSHCMLLQIVAKGHRSGTAPIGRVLLALPVSGFS
jgi:hypothetical protein